MTLVGVGEVKSRPDMAIINLGVVRQAKTARKAVSANNAAMAQIADTVRQAGVTEKDIQTSRFSVRPL
ncbi:MAG: SIMPL domain-containing protein, partial [Aestuariibacter sp.]|nr:SIMPL domain-containing protein [Aestuariibacter sp.]